MTSRSYLYLTVFVAGMTTLAVEFTTSRLIQTVFGTSNIVWANVIGLVLLFLTIGYFLGGSGSGIKSVMGLGAGQRNISAALVVAGQNFDMDVVTYLIVISVVGLVILMPLAGELGKRAGNASAETPA